MLFGKLSARWGAGTQVEMLLMDSSDDGSDLVAHDLGLGSDVALPGSHLDAAPHADDRSGLKDGASVSLRVAPPPPPPRLP